jgi:hypothetical protein
MAVTSKRKIDIECFKSKVKEFWDVMDHRPIKWFLGFEIKQNREAQTVLINQCVYIKSVIEKFRLTNTKKGSVLWSTVVSHPDTAYVVGVLSQFIQNPGPAHWEGVKRLISYLGHTKDLWLTFGSNKQTILKGYCDADWASQPHCDSISGFLFHYGQSMISWSFKKQTIITLLSTKAEYVMETHAEKEGIWLKT